MTRRMSVVSRLPCGVSSPVVHAVMVSFHVCPVPAKLREVRVSQPHTSPGPESNSYISLSSFPLENNKQPAAFLP